MVRFPLSCLWLFVLSLGLCRTGAEVVYDNTQFILAGYATENREYGDQVDLEGTARTITELTFYYYGDFVSDGDEGVKVRLYTNETPYDRYRNAPTTLLYESGTMPLKQGYNLRTLDNLNVKVPGNTLTFTIEFKGLATNEVAGLLLYSPPSVGASFNEFWGKTPSGAWVPFLYSTTDPDRKANAGLKIVAQPESALSASQTNATTAVTLRSSTANYRLAQIFQASDSGRLETVSFAMESAGSPVLLTLLDAAGDQPGTNVLGAAAAQPGSDGRIQVNFYSQSIFVKAGTTYALQIEATNAPAGEAAEKLLAALDDPYKPGQLWSVTNAPESGWTAAADSDGSTNLDAAFSVSIVAAEPYVRISSPAPGEIIPYGKTVTIGIVTNLPAISTIYRVRFFDGNQELDQVTAPPYVTKWTATNSGPHNIRVVVEETFGRQFRAEPHAVTVLEAPPAPVERRVSVAAGEHGTVTLKFDTKAGEKVQVQYSEDLEEWKSAEADLTGNGAELTFTDQGPPQTDANPQETSHRFYRVRFAD